MESYLPISSVGREFFVCRFGSRSLIFCVKARCSNDSLSLACVLLYSRYSRFELDENILKALKKVGLVHGYRLIRRSYK